MTENPFKKEETLKLAEHYFVNNYKFMKIIEKDVVNDATITLYHCVKNHLVKQDDVMQKESPIKQREKINQMEKILTQGADKSLYYYNHSTISQNSYEKSYITKSNLSQSPSKINQF